MKIKNPKRLQRAVKKQVKHKVSSKSQELLQLQYDERKKYSKQQSSLQKQLLKQEKFERKQQNVERSTRVTSDSLFHKKKNSSSWITRAVFACIEDFFPNR